MGELPAEVIQRWLDMIDHYGHIILTGQDQKNLCNAALSASRAETVLREPSVYVASRASIPERSAMWRRLRADGMPIVSTWIDEAGEGETGDFAELWARIQREIVEASALILYAEEGDFPLKGALVEVGVALALNKPVHIVLDFEPHSRTCKPIGSWIKHERVRRFPTVIDAWLAARDLVQQPEDKTCDH